ncbi:MAG: hypothetical protein JNL32_14710 [Candidatus Kapabacteria bacterium]|nr:hypothetical protein [Candidatus Kapabacteria bacterium]
MIALFSGCSIFRSNSIMFSIDTDDKANFGSPVLMDVLFINKDDLSKLVMSYSAKEWFDKREQFLRDNPDEDDIQSQLYEWIPGQKKTEIKAKGNGAREAIIFVNYSRSPSANRMRVITGSSLRFAFKESSYSFVVAD